MSALAVRLLLALLLGALVAPFATACDSSGEEVAPSEFPDEQPVFGRQLQGRVLRGAATVRGAVVHVAPAPVFGTDSTLDPTSGAFLTTTDDSGRYRVLNGPFAYDLSVRKDREIATFRGLMGRLFDVPLGAEEPAEGFRSVVVASTVPPPTPGNAVAFFVAGPDARSLSGSANPHVVTFRRFESVVTLLAVEYPLRDGPAIAVREGRVDIRVTNGGTVGAVVLTDPISSDRAREIALVVNAPPGFSTLPLDVVMDFGVRTASRPVARIAAGTPLRMTIVKDARYFVRAVAEERGALLDSGLLSFDPWPTPGQVKIELPRLAVDTSFDGASGFAAIGAGVVEHVLVPFAADGSALRVATHDRTTMLPDATRVGAPRASGRYAWTVQHFPTLKRTDNLAGEDVRMFTPVATTAPRTIDLP